jgi:hypothetical protein
MTMSLADFDDVCRVCSDWDKEGMFDDVITVRFNQLTGDSFTIPKTSRLNRWGEIAEKEMLNEMKDGVLI